MLVAKVNVVSVPVEGLTEDKPLLAESQAAPEAAGGESVFDLEAAAVAEKPKLCKQHRIICAGVGRLFSF